MTATTRTRKTPAATAADATTTPRADADTLDTLDAVHAPDATDAFRAIHADAVADAVELNARDVEAFRASITTRDAAAADDDATAADLTDRIFTRYAFHAAPLARVIGKPGDDAGTKALLPDDAKRVRLAIWNDAGLSEAPDAAARKDSVAFRTIGQYVSRFAKVAQNLDYGIPAMTTRKDADAAADAISADVAKVKKADAAKAEEDTRDAARVALVAWRATLDNADAAALSRVEHLFTGTGAVHFPAYVLMLNAKVSGN